MSRFPPKKMGWAGRSQTAQLIGLAAGAAAWMERAADGRQVWQYSTWRADSHAAGTAAAIDAAIDAVVARVQTASPKRPVTWVVSPSLAPSWLQQPSAQIASLSELQAVAQVRAAQLFGTPSSWPQATDAGWNVAGDWHAIRPFLCVALPVAWRELLQPERTGVAGERRRNIAHPLPLALSRLNKQLPRDGWLALAIAGEVHLMQRQRGHMTRLRSVRLPADTPSCTPIELLVQDEWQRELLRSQHHDEVLHWLDLTSKPHAISFGNRWQRITGKPSVHLPDIPPSASGSEVAASSSALHDALQVAWSAEHLRAGELT